MCWMHVAHTHQWVVSLEGAGQSTGPVWQPPKQLMAARGELAWRHGSPLSHVHALKGVYTDVRGLLRPPDDTASHDDRSLTTSLPVPADECCRLHQDQRMPPIKPAGKPNEAKTDSHGGLSRFHMALLIEGQLFTQKEILSGECGAGAQGEEEEMHAIT